MSIYRNTVWFIKGMKEYTKGGYASACKNFNVADLEVDVSRKSYMITGANSGIGKCAAIAIAKRAMANVQINLLEFVKYKLDGDSLKLPGYQYQVKNQRGIVHMVCRDLTRGEEARQEITSTTGNQNVFLHQLDMSKPKDVYKFAQSFESSGKDLDVLINNAGCMVNKREVTDDGIEKNFATNTLGVHILTTALIPTLSKQDKPRVITVTSGGMLVQKLNLKDLQFEQMKPFDGTMAYAQNKRQQVIMTEQYAKQYPNIHFSSMHPGWADTPAVKLSMPEFQEKMKNRLRTPEEGADTLIWLAISDAALKQPSGLFFQDRIPVPAHLPLAWTKSTPEENSKLMSKLEELSKPFQMQANYS